jgi:hypothetical protein
MRSLLAALAVLAFGCGGTKSNRGTDAPANSGPDACTGLQCAVVNCGSKGMPPTTITGKVFAPNGTLPLYNVTVYIPGVDPPPFPAGVQCGKCGDPPGGALTSTTTDAQGQFRLDKVPPGVPYELIVTTGKWRRKLMMPAVPMCTDTAIPDGMLRLPKNKSEGELPHIAVVTGGCDALACILSKVGIDQNEFGSSSSGNQSVVFYNGVQGSAPGSPAPSTALHGSLDEMKKFDIIINSCECAENQQNKTSPDLLRQYADLGGRVLGSHYHYVWTKTLIPAWQGTANWNGGDNTPPDRVDTSHASGAALATWLTAVGASTIPGQITLGVKTNNAGAVNAPTTRWLYSSGTNPTTHYLSFNTPVGVPSENQCGKVVYAGMHVSSTSTVGPTFPTGCSQDFTPDEKAMAFLMFELDSCVTIVP